MAPHPDPYPMPVAEAMALPHGGRYRACDDTPDDDSDDNDWSEYWSAYCSSVSAAADGSSPTPTGGFPGGSTFISAADSSGGSGIGSVKPVVIIVPVLVGVALLILAIGGCVIWRKKRRDAAARVANSGDAASVSSSAGLRGGALAMGEKARRSLCTDGVG
jgi:hypothetical protein